ncbi:hypothetical protein N802_08840 [Knoellia sinensis KCTC 19936]|uniref:GPI inositol-deacylase PGAP1-like alpha/beta domain-containing protein n=1 Tax=Knoellia sinensis KCTC 19936 TaxID=1385520 RepID=A0A0A0JEF9_9MICO|nr:hypothetical protein [Knoellia sinensis]KGN33981.1 hypothetical protein N802_08840 [Knoellia sinensis KCTC 19936]
MSDLVVTGGEGGVEVAVEDLQRAAAGMRMGADAISESTPQDAQVIIASRATQGLGAEWAQGPGILGAPLDLLPLVSQARRELRGTISDSRGVVERMRELADTLSSAARSYAWAEETVGGLVAGLHAQAMTTAWLVTEVTGQAFGLLDEGTGWDVRVARAEPLARVPDPTSTTSLLAGVESLGADGRVRVIEVPAADGTTTWVLQVPGTHSEGVDGWARGGEIPMDWPANVSLMLRATSASKIAAAKALSLAQAGRAGPRDRVVIVGHSQGGIVAAALASDPEFARNHRVTHVLTAGSPIDAFPIPDSTSVLSLQHATDAVPMLDVAPPPHRRNWTTVKAAAPGSAGAHGLVAYGETAGRAERSGDVALRTWTAGLGVALTPAAGSTPVVREFRSERRWQNRDS